MNILLERYKLLEDIMSVDIIGQNPIRLENKKKSWEILKENEHHLSPSVLGMYEWQKLEEEKLKEKDEGSDKDIENVKMNVNQYLEMDNDSDYENQIIKI